MEFRSRQTPVSVEEMKSEKVIIQKVHNIFRPTYKLYAIKKSGVIRQNHVDKLIENEIKKVPMTTEQEDIVQGFYDTYIGSLVFAGSDFAEGFAHSVFQ